MTSPSLAANGLLADPGRSASVARPSSSATVPVGPGAVRPAGGRGRFASLLAGRQDQPDHDGAEVTADEGRASPPEGQGGDWDKGPARQTAGQAGQGASSFSGSAGSKARPGGAGITGADESPDAGQQAGMAGSSQGDGDMPAPASAPAPARDQEGQAQQAAAPTAPQGLILAAFMALPQPVMAGGDGQLRPDGGDGDQALASSGRAGQAGDHAGGVAAASLPGMAPAGQGHDGAARMMDDLLAAMLAGHDKDAALPSTSDATSSSAAAGVRGDASKAAQARDSMAELAGQAGPHALGRGVLSGLALPGRADGGRGDMQQAMRFAAPSGPSALAVQAGTGGAAASVRMMAFQPGQLAGNAGAGSAGGRAVSLLRPEGGPGSSHGGEDALFALMVKASAQGGGASLAGSGGQGDSGGGPGGGASGQGTDMASGNADDGTAGVDGLSAGNASFAGLLGTGDNMAGGARPEGNGVLPDGSMARNGVQAPAASALQAGGMAAGVLTGHGATAPAGVLSMTVMTADAVPVHVQLARSAEGVAALSLQGGDDSMTDTLQKTHHLLARQLDDAGLHAGMMKIDVLPAGAGHMAGGQDQGMSGQQGQHGQGMGQPSGQSGGQAASWQGGFSAGGQGGDGGQGRQPPQGQAFPAPLSAGLEDGTRHGDESSPVGHGNAAHRPAMAGRLNISV